MGQRGEDQSRFVLGLGLKGPLWLSEEDPFLGDVRAREMPNCVGSGCENCQLDEISRCGVNNDEGDSRGLVNDIGRGLKDTVLPNYRQRL